jgi:hypothetical protein
MHHFSLGSSEPSRSLLLLLALLILAPAWAPAADMSFAGGSGCGDPPIFGEIFSLPPTNATGGMCKGFGNHSGANFDSLMFTTSLTNANPSDPFLCSPQPFFLDCGFSVDGSPRLLPSGSFITSGNTITVEFFGLNADHRGIPPTTALNPLTGGPADNFFINLNNPVCGTNGVCSQPFSDTAAGDWLTNGVPVTFTAAANGAPEPGTWALLLGGCGVLLARARAARNGRGR